MHYLTKGTLLDTNHSPSFQGNNLFYYNTKQKYSHTLQFLPSDSHFQFFPASYSKACFVAKELRGHKMRAKLWCSITLAWIESEDPEHFSGITWNI